MADSKQQGSSLFPEEVLEHVLSFLVSAKDRNSASLVCRAWHKAEAFTRDRVFIGNCYAISPTMVATRFPRIRSLALKGKPRFSDFNLVPPNWGADIGPWLKVLLNCNNNNSPFSHLQELRLKRMSISDDSLSLIAKVLPNFRVFSVSTCDGFSTDGLADIATGCRNLEELDLQESEIEDKGGYWLGCFPESSVSLVSLNFACLHSEVNFHSLERLVARCSKLKSLKVNKAVSLVQLQRLLEKAPQLIELGTGSFSQHLSLQQDADLRKAFRNCKQLRKLSGLWELSPIYISILNSVCANLTFLNLSYTGIHSGDLASMTAECHRLQRLWVLDTVEDKGLEAVSLNCKELRELRVFPMDPFGQDHMGVTEKGFLAIAQGCPELRYILYFCKQMTNAAVIIMARKCLKLTHFRLCIMNPCQPDHVTNKPMDEGFGAIVKCCKGLQRLSVSGLLTDTAFEYIGLYAKNLETLSVAFAGRTDGGMQCLLQGCPKLRKLEIRDSPFGDAALLSGLDRYESMRSLWMSACKVTMGACRLLAQKKPDLNVEIIKENEDEHDAEKLYVYRSVAGPRRDAPHFVLTL